MTDASKPAMMYDGVSLNQEAFQFETLRESARYAREVTSPGLMLAVARLKMVSADTQATDEVRALARVAALRLLEAAVAIECLEESADTPPEPDTAAP
jgi:hypothetical protein